MATNRPTKKPYFDRSIFPTGGGGAAVGIPAEVRRDQDLEPGKDGDTVDLEYDRKEATLTIFFDTD
ncbi:DUF1905 domain-containing protein [Halorubellus salinus]|uniref:DUF1905 domain-containing protein n=1 Tax=Halorubellus salinus TaxID=755309 RepID=UPI001D074200|nr:DUF1905 domain-containing protein [Halorubellus salinus]